MKNRPPFPRLISHQLGDPFGVSEYRISENLPAEIASDLPSIAEIESSLPAVSPAHRRKRKS